MTTARMQEVEQRREQLPRGNQNKEESLFNPPHPNLLPQGEGVRTLKSTALWADGGPKPILKKVENAELSIIHAHHNDPLFQELLNHHYLYCDGNVPLLFTENETNNARLFASPNAGPYVKDGINNYLVQGQLDAVNPLQTGTKASPHHQCWWLREIHKSFVCA